ncbi:MAG: glycoside hydrolase 100 family protein [Patescibacteria group bacterium]|jgi:hypothetical protein
MKDYTVDCYRESIKVLKENSNKFGVFASGISKQAKDRNYLSIFGRDASICSMGMVLSGDKTLQVSARLSLETLVKHQSKNGQIPFLVKPKTKQSDFYYLGCIDSTLWWLIAIKFYDQNTGAKLSKKFSRQINLAINWLKCQEHPKFYLVQQNEASDWADLMPRSGFVLYSNALWYWVKKLYNLENIKLTKKYFNYIFNPKAVSTEHRIKILKSFIKAEKNNPSYLSFVNYSFAGYEVDVLGNILACLVGLADDKKTKNIIKYFISKKANKPWPIKTVLKAIKINDKLWREYMNRHSGINKPYKYHNGAIWSFIGGFWVVLLSLSNKKLATEELARLAELNHKGNWQFREYFDGKNFKGYGMSRQSWNAALYIVAYKHLNS